jgi:CelD/BcsL family acetyltransferase involved in cellulose biosynthesis
MRELAFTDNDDCRGLIRVLFAGEQTAAVTFCLEGPGVIALWTLAYNPEFARFSAGTMQLLDLIRDAEKHGIRMVDFGFDHMVNTNTLRIASEMIHMSYVMAASGPARLGSAARSLYRRARYPD